MKKIYLTLILGIMFLSLASATTIYYENAQTTTLVGTWNSGSSTYDGNWNTAGYSDGGDLILTYAKINNLTATSNRTESYWRVKDLGIISDLTISEQCWNYNSTHLILKAHSQNGAGASWLCQYGSSSWETLRLSTADRQVFEEGFYLFISPGEYNLNFTETIYETQTGLGSNNYELNISQNVTNASFYYDNVSYEVNLTDYGEYKIIKIVDEIELSTISIGTHTFYYTLNISGVENNLTDSQIKYPIQFGLCNATLTNDFLNISFKDEDDLSTINASISSLTFIYYLGDGTINKTYNYVNNSVNYNYKFCATPTTETLKVKPYVQFKQGADYPQRIWDAAVQSYTSTVTNKILYLLGVADGIYVTYQVLDGTGDQLSGVEVLANRTISGEEVQVANGQTDAAGLVTFWLNPDFVHSLEFLKTGYESFYLSHFPTQSSYTITMGTSSSTTIIDYLLGMIKEISPSLGLTLNSNENYHFNFTLNSTKYDVSSFGFTLYGDDDVIGGNLSTTINSTIWNLINVSNYSQISMDYYYIINGTTTSAENLVWTVFNDEDTSWSIKQFFTDLSSYADDGIFGLNQAALNFIIFVIIFVIVGIVSYRFRITSPAAVSGMIFGLVFLFDVALGLIDIGVGVDHFPTIFIGLIMIALIVREAR